MSESKIEERMRTVEAEVQHLKKEASKIDDVNEKLDEFISYFKEPEKMGDRAVVDDLELLRQVYVKVKSARFFAGIMLGLVSALLPVIYMGYKIVEMLNK